MKKIVVTHEYAPFRGGAGTYSAEVAAASARLGYEVEVWTTGLVGEKRQEGVMVRRFGGRTSLALRNLIEFGRAVWLRREELRGAEVVLGSVGAHLVFLLGSAAGFFRGVEVWPVFHGSEVLRYRRTPGLGWLARRWLARCPRVLASSACARRLLLQSGLLARGTEVTVTPCAVRQELRAEAGRLPAPARKREGPIRFLALARLHPRKGHLDTVKALARLPEGLRKNVLYQVGGAGDEAYLGRIEAACREAGVPFEYLGEVPESRLAEVYAGCDVYVMTSRSVARSIEGFGMTYLEAACFGKPSVGYRSGGADEAVLDERSGILVEEGDIAALAEAFRKMAEEADLRQSFGQEGLRYAAGRDWINAARILFREPALAAGADAE